MPSEKTAESSGEKAAAQPESKTETTPVNPSDKTNPTQMETGMAAPVVDLVQSKDLLASDGRTYRVTVYYKSDSGIPDEAVLDVREILDGERILAAMTEAEKASLKPEEQKTEEEKKKDLQDAHYADYLKLAAKALEETKDAAEGRNSSLPEITL